MEPLGQDQEDYLGEPGGPMDPELDEDEDQFESDRDEDDRWPLGDWRY